MNAPVTLPPKPQTVCGNLDNLPAVFWPYTQQKIWCNWAWTWVDGRWTKPPLQPSGRNAKSQGTETWCTYADAVAAVKSGRADGIGIMLYGMTSLEIAIDIDHCRDSATDEIAPWARAIIEEANSYTEVTPSGTGVRILGIGDIGRVHKRFNKVDGGDGGLEVYTAGEARYITITGAQVPGCWPVISDIADVSQRLVQNKGRLEPVQPILAPKVQIPPKPVPTHERNAGSLGALLGLHLLDDELADLICVGAPNGKRSETFHHAVGLARRLNWTPDRLEQAMRLSPNGIAAKYLKPNDRLAAEIARCWLKVDPPKQTGSAGSPEECGDGGLICNAKGRPYANVANVMTVLRAASDWQGVVAYDRMAAKVMLKSPVPDVSGRKPNNFRARPLTDGDIVKAVEWFQHSGLAVIHKDTVADGLAAIAEENGFDPLEDKLRSLRWDGKPRIERWLLDYCGASITDTQPEAYITAVGRCWLISAVARALSPGCKVDTALVMVGPQGIGKSTAGRILAYNWFSDALPAVHSKDASDHLRGVWIVEFGEMATASRADVEELKVFVTRTVERFRPAYGRLEVEYPRRNVFFGTSNRDAFLKDETGNRRFWPVEVTAIDARRLEADRDQLWAEAVHAFQKGSQWHLSHDEAQLAAVQQAAYVVTDERTELLAKRIAGRATTTTLECLQLLEMKNEKREQMEVGGMLKSLGWRRKNNGKTKIWIAPLSTSAPAGWATGGQPGESWG